MHSYRNFYFLTFVNFYYSLLLPQWASLARILIMGSIFVWCSHSTGSSANVEAEAITWKFSGRRKKIAVRVRPIPL